mmetsp:Transcript_24647/g.77270  ORF Transcript_24647/g.77270 Transcript_24647/m.77270 type:complete len:679 (-) Transcript_24647:43-2079(-)
MSIAQSPSLAQLAVATTPTCAASLLDAVKVGTVAAVAAFLDAKGPDFDVDAERTSMGLTALHLACKRNLADVVALLLRRGAAPGATSLKKDGRRTAVIIATRHRSHAALRALLANAATAATLDARILLWIKAKKLYVRAHTALNLAALAGNEEAVTLLIDAGADVNVVDQSGDTPLYNALKRKHFDVARTILKLCKRTVDPFLLRKSGRGRVGARSAWEVLLYEVEDHDLARELALRMLNTRRTVKRVTFSQNLRKITYHGLEELLSARNGRPLRVLLDRYDETGAAVYGEVLNHCAVRRAYHALWRHAGRQRLVFLLVRDVTVALVATGAAMAVPTIARGIEEADGKSTGQFIRIAATVALFTAWLLAARLLLLNRAFGPLIAAFLAMTRRIYTVVTLVLLLAIPFGVASFTLFGDGADGAAVGAESVREIYYSFLAVMEGDALESFDDQCRQGNIMGCIATTCQLLLSSLIALNLIIAFFTSAYDDVMETAVAAHRHSVVKFAYEGWIHLVKIRSLKRRRVAPLVAKVEQGAKAALKQAANDNDDADVMADDAAEGAPEEKEGAALESGADAEGKDGAAPKDVTATDAVAEAEDDVAIDEALPELLAEWQERGDEANAEQVRDGSSSVLLGTGLDEEKLEDLLRSLRDRVEAQGAELRHLRALLEPTDGDAEGDAD